MAVGDVTNAHISITAGNSYDVRPTAGSEWVVHNIYVPNGMTVSLYKSDGVSDILISVLKCSMLACNFHVTNTCYLKAVNDSASTTGFGFDGIVTK